jgi:cobalt/nickel transport system permease protein
MCVIPILLSLVSKIPMKDFLKRTALIPFFAAVISLPVLFITPGTPTFNANLSLFNLTVTFEGIQRFALFTIRVWFCVASLSLFILSTGFNAFLKLLSSLRVPWILIQMFSLTYRYLFLSIHEIQRVLIAREARTYVNRHSVSIDSLKHSGALLATVFIRTYERSERVYMAMKSRGFDINNTSQSSIPPLHVKDSLFAASTMVIFGLILIL